MLVHAALCLAPRDTSDVLPLPGTGSDGTPVRQMDMEMGGMLVQLHAALCLAPRDTSGVLSPAGSKQQRYICTPMGGLLRAVGRSRSFDHAGTIPFPHQTH